MPEKPIEKGGEILLLLILVLVGLILAVMVIVPKISGGTGLTNEAQFHTKCLDWFRSDPACPLPWPDMSNYCAPGKLYNDEILCQKICQNGCNPYGVG